jgi:glutathione S-transferase
MITLYHNDMSVCAAKVRTALAEKNLKWDGVHLDLRGGDAQQPEYLKLNPNAVVPTLVHDGRPLIESTVICEYIDDHWPEPPLKPADGWGRAQMRLWTNNWTKAFMRRLVRFHFASPSGINGSPVPLKIAPSGRLAFRKMIGGKGCSRFWSTARHPAISSPHCGAM